MMRDRGQMSSPTPKPGPHCKRFGPLLPLTFREDLLGDEASETETLHEHVVGCVYCRRMLAIYAVEEQALIHSFAAQVASTPRYAEEIIARLQEEPIVSQLPGTPTPEQPPTSLQTRDIAHQRLVAARLAMRPPKRHIPPLVAWLAPVAVVLLIALLAKVIFTTQHPTGPVAPSPLALTPGVQISLGAISMVAPSEGWALGSRAVYTTQDDSGTPKTQVSVLLHDHNGSWTATSIPATYRLQAIAMVSPTDGWAVGNQGLILHYDGRSWSTVKSPTNETLLSIKMLSATDGWASGENSSPRDPALILHYDGHMWQQQTAPIFSQASYTSDLQPQLDGEAWALVTLTPTTQHIAPIDASALLHYDGHQWHIQQSLPNASLYSLSMSLPQDGWMLGNSTTGASPLFLWHYHQGTLTRLPAQQVTQQISTIPSGSAVILSSLSMVSPTDGWAIGSWGLGGKGGFFTLHYTGDAWKPVSLPRLGSPSGFSLYVISFQPDGEGWAVGSISKSVELQGQQPFVVWAPLVLHYAEGTWTVALE
jgi:photosystem II stability/assembly factor-like uncharacterized protein